MKIVWVFSLLCLTGFGNQIKSVTPIGKTHVLPLKEIEIATGQEMFYYFPNERVYGTDLYQVEKGKSNPIQTPRELRNGVNPDIDYETNSCYQYRKTIKIEELLRLRVYEDTNNVFISDIMVIPQMSVAYLVTDTYLVHEIRFTYVDGLIDSASIASTETLDLKPTLSDNRDGKSIGYGAAKFVQHNSIVDGFARVFPMIVTRYGVVTLSISQKEKASVLSVQYPTIKRLSIKDVYSNGDFIYVAVGVDGVDVYQITNSRVIFITNISHEFVEGQQSFNIVGVSSYLADSNTFIVIAETVNGIEYVAELFVDFKTKEYYFNRVYIEDTAFNRIIMDQQYTYLISEDDHLVIEHSILNTFVPKSDELVTSFQQEDLIAFEHMHKRYEAVHKPYQATYYYLGLAKGEIKVFEVTNINPGLYCQFNKKGKHQYRAVMNASTCTGHYDEKSVFEQCQITQMVTVEVRDPLVESDKLITAIIILGSVCLTLSILACLTFLCSRKWRQHVMELKNKVIEAKTYSQFQEVEASSMVLGEPKHPDLHPEA